MPFEFQKQPACETLAGLFEVAKRDTGQSRRWPTSSLRGIMPFIDLLITHPLLLTA
jgi:hypothetical protein